MIFYFSGTGNSLYVAQKLHEDEGSELVDMAEALGKKYFNYEANIDEKIGFVFPVYFYGLPTVVFEFLENLNLKSQEKPFVYTVITCAGSIGNADKTLGKMFEEKNLELNSSFTVTMPNNYNIMSNLPDEQKQSIILQNAEKEIDEIVKALNEKTEGNFAKHDYFSLFTPIVYPLYGFYRHTNKFHATEDCNRCGSCQEMCPTGVIKMKNGIPTWTEEICSHCSACINRCPTQAIQYGNSTIKRRRYVNPNVEFS